MSLSLTALCVMTQVATADVKSFSEENGFLHYEVHTINFEAGHALTYSSIHAPMHTQITHREYLCSSRCLCMCHLIFWCFLTCEYFIQLIVLDHCCLGMFAQGDACIRARFREYVCFCECVYTRM